MRELNTQPESPLENVAWPAPAKLNLFLHVTGQREDGYHQLQTLFQFLDYGDRLRFRRRDDGKVQRVSSLKGVAEQEDLTVCTAKRLQSASDCKWGVEINVEKNLAMGAGLGGGSSDAATTLVILNELWGLGHSSRALAEIGAQLGADIPVFVLGKAAWAEGVGEKLTPVDLPEPWYIVISPSVLVSTARLFAAPELTRDARPITIRDYLAGATVNAFEDIVRKRFPVVDEALKWLAQFGENARMTGTGSSVFLAVEDETTARRIVNKVPDQWPAFVARGRNESPLITQRERLCGRRSTAP